MKDASWFSARAWVAFAAGAAVGALGGLIGLGGAEFRLPLLIAVFGFVALEAVILNKGISLVVVASALLFRGAAVPFADVIGHWSIVVNLLAGSLLGAWLGADFATRLSARTLHRVIAGLLLVVAVVLALGHGAGTPAPLLQGPALILAGVAAGVLIGAIASLLGVAGGEFLIPTLILLFGTDIKLAGSLSLAISLPTMLVGLARYSREQSFRVWRANKPFAAAMALGSILGACAGSRLLIVAPSAVIVPILVALLLASSIKIWRHPSS